MLANNIYKQTDTVMFCKVEAELHEIEIESIDGTREVEGSRGKQKNAHYNGQHFLMFTATVI